MRQLIAFNVQIPILIPIVGIDSGVDSIVGTVEWTPIIGERFVRCTCRRSVLEQMS